jgi:hypothetical protein
MIFAFNLQTDVDSRGGSDFTLDFTQQKMKIARSILVQLVAGNSKKDSMWAF